MAIETAEPGNGIESEPGEVLVWPNKSLEPTPDHARCFSLESSAGAAQAWRYNSDLKGHQIESLLY